MPVYRVQSTIPTNDNIAANYATNLWHTLADDLTAANLFLDELEDFYEEVDGFMSDFTRQNGWTFKVYNTADPEPRAPLIERTWNLAVNPSGAPLPAECALVMSFQGVKVSGQAQARRRGRIYLPFLDAASNDSTGRPGTSTVAALNTAGDNLLTASTAASTWKWGVWSPTSLSFAQVANGWVDNEWDTQRRRGRVATTRSTFS